MCRALKPLDKAARGAWWTWAPDGGVSFQVTNDHMAFSKVLFSDLAGMFVFCNLKPVVPKFYPSEG